MCFVNGCSSIAGQAPRLPRRGLQSIRIGCKAGQAGALALQFQTETPPAMDKPARELKLATSPRRGVLETSQSRAKHAFQKPTHPTDRLRSGGGLFSFP